MMSPSTPRAAKLSASSRSRAGILVRGTREHQRAAPPRHVLDAAMETREERVGHVLDNEPEARGRPVRPPEDARREVAPVAEDVDGVVDALGQVPPHVAAAVDDA